ncbi:ion transporter [Mariprofundus erugo]|uniref:Ion transporter n=1 Tax=Mariprofundus erugo TaxID=2528639 RepID=A0A5R9GVM8_9PROT|nr:potassium channel family protein [Mariprofundus erugo]TLS68187.1 ion transporter [Mariprofundus erugo]
MSRHARHWKHTPIANPLRARLNRWLFDLSSKAGRRTNATLMIIIIASVIIGMFATVGHLEARWKALFYTVEIGIITLFIIEYIARLLTARRPLAYALSFYGLVDLATLLPLLILGDANTAIRLLRVFRLLKLIRYLRALQLFIASLRDVFEIMAVVISAISIIVLVAGNLIYLLEPENITNAFEGCWWSLVTMTTVGYGDIVPHSAAGRILASVLIMIGISTFAMLTGVISVKISHSLAYQRSCPACARMIAQEFSYCPYCATAQHPPRQRDDPDHTPPS